MASYQENKNPYRKVNRTMLSGEITNIITNDNGDATLQVKTNTGELVAVRQVSMSKKPLADMSLRVAIGKDSMDDDLRGMGVGSRIYTDYAVRTEEKVGDLDLVNVNGISVLAKHEYLMNEGKPGVMIAFHPFNGKHADFKRGRNGYEYNQIVGETAKVSTIMTGEGATLTHPTAGELRDAVVAAAQKAILIAGMNSAVVHVMSDNGVINDFPVPIFKDPQQAFKSRKNGVPLTKDDYLDKEGRLLALAKNIDELTGLPDDEVIENTLAVVPRVSQVLTKMSASNNNHANLINLLRDDLQESDEALAKSLKDNGWAYRGGDSGGFVVMSNKGGTDKVVNYFPDVSSKSRAPVQLPEALGRSALALIPEFDIEAYKQRVEVRAEERELNRVADAAKKTPDAPAPDAPASDASLEASIDDDAMGDVPSFHDDDVPSFG